MHNFSFRHKNDNFDVSLNAASVEDALNKITNSGVTKKEDWKYITKGPVEIYRYTRHVVPEMSNGIQRCVICGKVVVDYRNAVSDQPGNGNISGWAAGNLYMSEKGNPTVMVSELPDEPWYEEKNCK